MSKKIKILICDDSAYVVAKKLAKYLEDHHKFNVCRCVGMLEPQDFNVQEDEVIFLSSAYEYFKVSDKEFLKQAESLSPGFYDGELQGTKVLLYSEA